MFRKKVMPLSEIMARVIRDSGMETPLLQKRLIDGWEVVAGNAIAKYTQQKYIKNQTLFIKLSNPALRQDLSMRRTDLVRKLNEHVGSFIISEIRFY